MSVDRHALLARLDRAPGQASGRFWLIPALFGLAALSALAFGWREPPAASAGEVVRVREVVPREVEPGDRVAVLGEGYPTGKPARVSFRGTLHRPGERAQGGAEIVLAGVVVSPERLEVPFGDDAQALFCDRGERAAHTTFEGVLEVAFAPIAPGGPPIAGLLDHVTLDVRPSPGPVSAEREAQHEREGERTLAWLGLRAASRPSGLLIEGVEPGSRAEASGFTVGDVLEEFDGVRVASAGDIVPAPGTRSAVVLVRNARSGAGGAQNGPSARLVPEGPVRRVLRTDGFRRAPSAELFETAWFALAAIAVVVLFAAPSHPAVLSVLQRAVAQLALLRQRRATHSDGTPPGRPGPGREKDGTSSAYANLGIAPPGRGQYQTVLAETVAYALVTVVPFGPCFAAVRLDVLVVFVGAATALAAAALLRDGPWRQRVREAAGVALLHAPAAAAVAGAVVMTGSLRVQEIVLAQGGWPWDWLAFRSPSALGSVALLLTCARAPSCRTARAPSHPGLPAISHFSADDACDGPMPVRGLGAFDAMRWAHCVVIAGLASILFLGGWLLPGHSVGNEDVRPALRAFGAACLLVKTWGLTALVAWTRRVLPRRAQGHRVSTALSLSALAVASLAATAAWTWWSPEAPVQRLASASLATMVALVSAALVHRLGHGLSWSRGDGRLSPFL